MEERLLQVEVAAGARTVSTSANARWEPMRRSRIPSPLRSAQSSAPEPMCELFAKERMLTLGEELRPTPAVRRGPACVCVGGVHASAHTNATAACLPAPPRTAVRAEEDVHGARVVELRRDGGALPVPVLRRRRCREVVDPVRIEVEGAPG